MLQDKKEFNFCIQCFEKYRNLTFHSAENKERTVVARVLTVIHTINLPVLIAVFLDNIDKQL